MNSEKRAALVVGGTGLTGSYLLEQLSLSNSFRKTVSLVRRPGDQTLDRVEEFVVDFGHLRQHVAELPAENGFTDAFCCLGTTIAKAGSRQAFEAVDHRYPLEFAEGALSLGVQRFYIVTAMGAAADSRIFYNRVKGKVEQDLAGLGFDSLHIYRPSLLLGSRNERRPAEALSQRIAPLFSPLMAGPLKAYRAIRGKDVARAMRITAEHAPPGMQCIYPSDQIQQIADTGIWKAATV